MTNPLTFVPAIREAWGADNTGNLRKAYDTVMTQKGYQKVPVKKGDIIITGEAYSAGGDYGEWGDFTCFTTSPDAYKTISSKYKSQRGIDKAVLEDFFGKGAVEVHPHHGRSYYSSPTFRVQGYGVRVSQALSDKECFAIPENLQKPAAVITPSRSSGGSTGMITPVGKMEAALNAVITTLGFPSTKGAGKCICYGGARKCGALSALWSEAAYSILRGNGIPVNNAADLINLDLNNQLKKFSSLQLRGGYVLCNPNL